MKYYIYIFFAFILAVPVITFAQPPDENRVTYLTTDKPDEEAFAIYDLRNRKTYVQVSNDEDQENPLCIHVQIFQQDQGCSELDFEDQLTPNDTVIYDMDNLVRNDGTEIPVNLDEDSYGFVAISAYVCGDRTDDGTGNPLLGNFRIIDNSGYEYRMNLITDESGRGLNSTSPSNVGNINIPFNTVDGASHADIYGFVFDDDRELNGVASGNQDRIYNEEAGITFSVFQVDEDEEILSCDQKTIGCGPNVTFHYGINEDYRASRGNNLFCEGAGLLPGQSNGYISLENASFLSPLQIDDTFHFVCVVGLNNGDSTGSMDECLLECVDDDQIPNNCVDDNIM